jgi:rhodanese-related sulfurtransferase
MEHLSQFIMNHWVLWLIFIVLLALTFINDLLTKNKKEKELTPQAVVDLMNHESIPIIDIRNKETFQQGHIIDSIQGSINDFETSKLSQYKDKPVILVCARGIESVALAKKLRTQGYIPSVLSGGIAAWQNASLPLVKGK